MAQTHSHACCTVPPVVTEGYKPKGEYITINGLKTYATGPKDAKDAIFVVYDIFGFFPQTLQGADILAYGDKDRPVQVFIPDFFEGDPADISWYPPQNDEQKKKLGDFFGNQAAPPKTIERVPATVKAIEAERPAIKQWGVLGYCWGGIIVNKTSQKDTPWKVAAVCHPASIAADDASGLTIPHAMLLSGDESKDDTAEWEKAIKVKNIVQWYPDQVHGWMAARADLKDNNVKSNYEKGYQQLLEWFHEHLS